MKHVGDCFETKHKELVNRLEERALHVVNGGDVKAEEEEGSVLTSNLRFHAPWSFFKVLGDPVVLTMAALYRKPFLVVGVMKLLATIVGLSETLILRSVLRSFESGKIRTAQNFCIALFVCIISKNLLENQYLYKEDCLEIKVGGALSTAVYRKSLRLSASACQSHTAGEMTNYMQLDAQKIAGTIGQFHTMWINFLQVIFCGFLLHRLLGSSAFIGILVMIGFVPFNAAIFQRLSKYRTEILGHTDARIRVINEMLHGIRAIKFYNWEEAFKARLNDLHETELRVIQTTIWLTSLVVGFVHTLLPLIIGMSLITYSYLGNMLNPSTVFTAIAIFQGLRVSLYLLPITIGDIAQTIPSFDRLSTFLVAEEVIPFVQKQNNDPYHYANDITISIQSGIFTWTQAPPIYPASQKVKESSSEGKSGSARTPFVNTPCLYGIHLEVKKGELVAIVGEVGTGKSSLVRALLGEIRCVTGCVYVNGSVAYVPQIPWIPNDTVRGNVLFGNEYKKNRYREALSASCLDHDLELLAFGDMTEIGEQGINLSGGQKQRLSIARALYKGADIYLLDDPLSALDPQVGQEVFDWCICGTMARDGATRILVTNQLQYLPLVDRVIVMGKFKGVEGGTVIDQGTYEELQTRSHNLLGAVNSASVQAVVEKASGGTEMASELPVTHSYAHGIKESPETTPYGLGGSPLESSITDAPTSVVNDDAVPSS